MVTLGPTAPHVVPGLPCCIMRVSYGSDVNLCRIWHLWHPLTDTKTLPCRGAGLRPGPEASPCEIVDPSQGACTDGVPVVVSDQYEF